MFGKQALGCPLHLCLRQLCFRMPNDVSCALLIERRIEEYVTFWWRGNGVCWDIGTCFRYNGQGTARRALSLLGCSLSAGYLAFSASSDINKGWCVIADKRIICWRRIFDPLPTSADYWGWSTIYLLRVFVRMQRSNMRWKMQQKKFLYVPHHQCLDSFYPRQCSKSLMTRRRGVLAIHHHCMKGMVVSSATCQSASCVMSMTGSRFFRRLYARALPIGFLAYTLSAK